jgi:predicted phosphodiesterase
MKIAIIADIHSNYAALEACLESVRHEKADGIVFLGDYVSDCPYPQKTLASVRKA